MDVKYHVYLLWTLSTMFTYFTVAFKHYVYLLTVDVKHHVYLLTVAVKHHVYLLTVDVKHHVYLLWPLNTMFTY